MGRERLKSKFSCYKIKATPPRDRVMIAMREAGMFGKLQAATYALDVGLDAISRSLAKQIVCEIIGFVPVQHLMQALSLIEQSGCQWTALVCGPKTRAQIGALLNRNVLVTPTGQPLTAPKKVEIFGRPVFDFSAPIVAEGVVLIVREIARSRPRPIATPPAAKLNGGG